MTGLLLILELLSPWTFSAKGFAMAQEGKHHSFSNIVLVTSSGSKVSVISKEIIQKLRVSFEVLCKENIMQGKKLN